MPIDVRMPDGTLVTDVPDNITQADLMARFDAFKAQPVTSAPTVAPEIQVTPQAPQVGPEGAPIPPVLQTQPKEEMSASKAAKATAEEVGSIARRLIADPALGLAKGVINAEEFLVGLGDILTGGRAGKSQEETMKERGMPSPQQMKDFLTSLQSPERIESVKKVAEAKGFGPTALSLIENPAALSEIVESSLPSMAASQVGLGRYLLPKVAPKMGAVSRGAVGEATVQAGSMAEQVRQQNEDRLLTPKQSAMSVVSGVLTGTQGLLGGKVAQKLGLQDVDTLLAGGVSADVKRNILTTAFKSALAESAFEEMPQSVQEQISQNIALGRPPLEGVAEAGAAGALAGFATAGGITGVSQFQQNRRIAKEGQPTPPPVSERIEPEVTPLRETTPEAPVAEPTPQAVQTSYDTQAMMDELSGKDVEFVPEEETKTTEASKEEPTGVITEEDKEFTPVGGKLINKTDADRLARESAIALEQNLADQEVEKEKQLKQEIREEKFREPPTQTLSARLVQEGGISREQKRDMLGETGKIEGYDHVFRVKGNDLLTLVKDGKLDDYLPPDLRTTAVSQDGLYDARPGYNYISDMIKTGEKVHTYEYEMAKLQHENMVYEKNLAKQQMEPNEAARAAAAETQGKEYMNIKPDEIVPPLTKGSEVGTMEWLTEDNPPVHSLYEGNKSLRVEMNKLGRYIESGRASDAEVKDAVLNILETTKKPKEDRPLVRGPEQIKSRLLEAKRLGTLSPKAVDMAEWLINKNPEIMRESAISIKEEPEGNKKAGEYVPEKRLIQLFNRIGDEKTPVHESLHSVERLLPEDIRSGIRKAWLNNLFKEYHNASKSKDENLKQYFKGIVDYHLGENPIGDKVAKDIIQKGLVNKSNYQFFNPSEFWAIRGSDIVANRFNAEISKSTVNKLKQWIKEFIQKLKSTFGLSSDAPIIRALDSLAKSDGKFKTNDMLAESAEYASISKPPRNIKGQEVIPQWHGPEESKIDEWIYRLQNKQIDTKRVQELIGDIEEDWNVYEKEQLYHGRTAAGIRNFLLKELLPVIKDIERLKISPEDVRTYLHNRHAEERNIQMNKINPDIYDEKTGKTIPNPLKDKGSGISTADAKAYLAGLDPAKKQILENVAKKFDEMIKGTQQILINSGAESADTIAKWNKTYEHYVPLFRVEDEMARPTGMGGTGQGFGVRGAFSKRALGSEKDVQDILSNIIAQRERALIRAEKIRVGRALYGLAIQNPNPDFWLPINPDAIRNKKQAIAELRRMGVPDAEQMIENLMAEPKERYLKKTRVAEEGFEPDEDFDFDSGLPVNESKEVVASKINVMARYKDFVFPVRINGKDRYIFFNKNDPRALRMVQSLKNLDVEQLGYLENIFGKFTRWFKNVNTQYNPVFGLVNFLRDMSGTFLNLTSTEIKGKQAQVIAGAYKAMGGILNVHRAERKGKPLPTGPWAKLYQEARDEGFQTGYRDSLIRNQEEMQIVENTLSQFKDGNTKKAFYAVLGALTDYNDMMENAFRLSAYKVALDQGLSKQKAAIIAKNLTVNFDKKGAWTSQVNALYAFFNASVQGTERIYQTLKGPKGKLIIGGGILAGMVQAVMLASAGYGDDDPPEFVRERNFIVPLADGTYMTIPYPLGYNLLPNSGRITMDFMIRGGRDAGKHMTSLMSALMNSLNPLGSSGFALQTMMPTAIDPVVALAENKDSFGRPIYRPDRSTAPTPGYTRSRDTASTLGKGIAEFLNWASGGTKYQKGSISPTGDEVDFLAGQVGGGLYREISKAGKAIGAQSTGEALAPYQRPIVSRFYGETGSPAAVSQTFYNNVTRMTDHENEIKGRMKNREDVEGYLNDNPDARLWKRANTIENKVNELNKRKRMFIDRGFPKERIQAIDAQKTMLMQRFNDQVSKLTPE